MGCNARGSGVMPAASSSFHFADVAITPTANEFQGIYRGKKQHDEDFTAVLDRAAAADVTRVMLTCMSLSDIDFIADIVRSRPQQCSMTIGCHPYHATEPESDPEYFQKMISKLRGLVAENSGFVSAFGELGLDYDRTGHAAVEVQIRTFKAQMDLFVAEKLDLPLFLHCRAAFGDFVEIIRSYIPHLPRGGLIHSFVGSTAEMNVLVDLGLHISVNGFSFQDATSLDMVKSIPLDKLLLETDAPWGNIPANGELAKKFPSPIPKPASKKRDKFEKGLMVKDRNESCSMPQVTSIVAGIRGLSFDEVKSATWENSFKLFRF